jgi:hypothetical protein
MAYLLDANVFISAKDLHYGFDFCPAFWDWIVRENQSNNVYSVEHVGGELVADYYLVAQALAGAHTVVTHERPENSVHRVKIPNVCLGLRVRFINPFEMLRRERARFVLAARA